MARKRKNLPSNRQLKNRAARQAQRSNQGTQAQIDAARRSAYKTYNTELGAARGAKRANLDLLRNALANVPKGLSGMYRDQYIGELTGLMDDSKGTVKYERAGLRSDLQDALAGVRADQMALDQSIAEDTQTNLQDALKKRREKAADLREKRTDYEREVEKALAEIRQSVAKTRGTSPSAMKTEIANLRADAGLRRNLVDYLITSQDISTPAAKKAVSILTRGKNSKIDKIGQQITGTMSGAAGRWTQGRPGFADAVMGAINRLPFDDEDR